MKLMMNKLRHVLVAAGICATAHLHAAEVDVIADQTESTSAESIALGVPLLDGNTTWTKNNVYILKDRLYVPSGVTLTIEAGTRIYGSSDDQGTGDKTDDLVGAVVVARGGKIMAEGTVTEPIVFGSIREYEMELGYDTAYDRDLVKGPAPTQIDAGHWGGVVLLGHAPVTITDSGGANVGEGQIEGFAGSAGADDDGDGRVDVLEFGGSDPADSSGKLKHVVIRHGGYEFATASEINGLTLGGVGSGTGISYVEVFANQDDGIEFFGGTVATDHMVMVANHDDSFDLDQGHQAVHQFWFAMQTGNDGSGGALHDNGGEWDGIDGDNKSAGFSGGLPLSKPYIYNATFIGAGTGALDGNDKGNNALLVEDYFDGEIHDSVFDEFAEALIEFKDNATSTGGGAAATNNTVGRFGDLSGATTTVRNLSVIDGTNSDSLFYNALGQAVDGNSNAGTDPQFCGIIRGSHNDLVFIDPSPRLTSPLLVANGATLNGGAPEAAGYRGAFGVTNWAYGWSRMTEFFDIPVLDIELSITLNAAKTEATLEFTASPYCDYVLVKSLTLNDDFPTELGGVTTDGFGRGSLTAPVDLVSEPEAFVQVLADF